MNGEIKKPELRCTLPNDELIQKSQDWVEKLCKSGGKAWTLQVPVNFSSDPDVILIELIDRYRKLLGNASDSPPTIQGAGVWVKANERLPEIRNKKATPRYVKVERQKYDKSGTWIQKQVAYYFPDRFKTVEWEDWDDYNQEDFPYTEEDVEMGVVWLRAGWYSSIDCDKCEGYWSAPLDVVEWLDESGTPSSIEQG